MMIRIVAGALVSLLIATAAHAQSGWPSKPVRIVVPTAAGGTADNLARMYAQHMSKTTGQQFYVENRGGAGNVIGIEQVVRAPADGLTILVGAGTITINHLVVKKLPYDVLRDLVPVTQLISVPNVLVVHPSQPMNTLADYIAAAKAKPGSINYASAGIGSNLHLAMELLKYRTGIDVTHVPYKGVGPALQDTLAGHVASMVSNVPSAKPQIDGKNVKALAILTKTRSPVEKDVPTSAEQGLDVQAYTWNAIFLPKGTPDAIVKKLNGAMVQAMHDAGVKDRLEGFGAQVVSDDRATPDYLGKFVKDEIVKWAAPIKASGVSVN